MRCHQEQPASGSPAAPAQQPLTGLIALISVLTAIASLLQGRDPFRVVVIIVGMGSALAAYHALTKPHQEHSNRWLVALVVGLGFCAWATSSKPRDPPPPAQRDTRGSRWLRVGSSVSVGVRPTRVVGASDGLWVATASGLVHFDPRRGVTSPDVVSFPAHPFDLAAAGRLLVVVHGGHVSLIDTVTRRRTRDTLHFSESPGRVAAGFGSAWICNETHAKIDRWDLRTGAFKPIPVPGTPTGVLVTAGSVWVAVQQGWVVRIDPRTGEVVARIPTEEGPGALAFGFGRLWVAHPRSRRVTQIDPELAREVGRAVIVGPEVRALAVLKNSVWAVSGATDQVLRIDPHRGRVVARVHVDPEPTALTAFADRLFVSSANAGTVTPIELGRGPASMPGRTGRRLTHP